MTKTVEIEVLTRETLALKQCPFCAAEDSLSVINEIEEENYVHCATCRANGPVETGVKAAVITWNTRRRSTKAVDTESE